MKGMYYSYPKQHDSNLPNIEVKINPHNMKGIRATSIDDLKKQLGKALDAVRDSIVSQLSREFEKWYITDSGIHITEEEYQDLRRAPSGYGMLIFSYYSHRCNNLPSVSFYVPAESLLPTLPGIYAERMQPGDITRHGYHRDKESKDGLALFPPPHIYENFFRVEANTQGWLRVHDWSDKGEAERDLPGYLAKIGEK